MIGEKKELIKSMYTSSFAQHKGEDYSPWDREAVGIALDWLFHYAEENRHEVMQLTYEQAKRFLIWFNQAARDTDTRQCVIDTLINFYDYLVSIDWALKNPFRRIQEEGIECLMRRERREGITL